MKKGILALAVLLVFTSCQAMGKAGSGKNAPDAALEHSLLSAFAAQADTHLQTVARDLDVLAAAPVVRSGDWKAMEPLMDQYQQERPWLLIYWALPDGSYYKPRVGLTDKNLADRDYFPDLLAGKKVFGNLVIGKTSKKKSAIVAAPVMNGGKMASAVGSAVYLESLNQILTQSLDLPDDMFFFALAPDGVTTLNSHPDRIFLEPRKQKSASMTQAMESILGQNQGTASYEFKGKKRRVNFLTSPVTGWKYALGREE